LKLREVISKNVKRIRKEKGLSQVDLAKLAKVHLRYVTRLENHPQNLHIDHIELIARGLGVLAATLLIEKRSENEKPAAIRKKIERAKKHLDGLQKELDDVSSDVDLLM
jgi:transcriptional regulator with XRE-family HTH domain